MRIRNRLALWYAIVLFSSIVIIFSLFYFFEYKNEKNRRDREEDLEEFLSVIWYGIPTTILALAGGWWLTRKALEPVEILTKAAENIHDRNLHIRLPLTGNGDELDRLTQVFNQMISRLDISFQKVRDFSLHASHELKTPLTVLHGQLEGELSESNLSQPKKEEILSKMDEVQRLARIVDGLSLLTKADTGQIQLRCENLFFSELVKDSFEDAKILARPSKIEVEITECEDLKIKGDRDRLRQLLLNLTDNAVKYNQVNGKIQMSLKRRNDTAELIISNTGKGISKDKLERVFDRFFRCDESHERDIEGCGLGLSIAEWIVKAHHGCIGITSVLEGTTMIKVSLPLVE